MTVDTERAADLDDLMARLTATDHRYRYSVAWIDLLARGAAHRPGRAHPRRPRPARRAAGAGPPRPARLPAPPAAGRAAPGCPTGCSARTTVGAVQRVLVPQGPPRAARQAPEARLLLPPAGRPADWNRIYGRAGFVQYQFVVGHGAGGGAAPVVQRLSAPAARPSSRCSSGSGRATPAGCPSRCPGGPWPSTSPPDCRGSARCSTSWTSEVAAAGGRVYLAKDSRLRPDAAGPDVPAAGRLPFPARPLRPARRHHLRPGAAARAVTLREFAHEGRVRGSAVPAGARRHLRDRRWPPRAG